jgi:hypothetical protein
VVSVVVPLMLAVLPYARGRGFDSRSRLLNAIVTHSYKPELVGKFPLAQSGRGGLV